LTYQVIIAPTAARARRGEYRIRYTIDDAISAIHVLDIDHCRAAHRA
jgi:mRNA-degrading endonuclease RelE of RelBE toxin-antitoxin system